MNLSINKLNPSADYQPQSFKNREIWVEVYHRSPKGSDKVFANIKRIWPAFNRGVPPRDGISRADMEHYLKTGAGGEQRMQEAHSVGKAHTQQIDAAPVDDFDSFGPATGEDDLPF